MTFHLKKKKKEHILSPGLDTVARKTFSQQPDDDHVSGRSSFFPCFHVRIRWLRLTDVVWMNRAQYDAPFSGRLRQEQVHKSLSFPARSASLRELDQSEDALVESSHCQGDVSPEGT